jgi:hypothetical protein
LLPFNRIATPHLTFPTLGAQRRLRLLGGLRQDDGAAVVGRRSDIVGQDGEGAAQQGGGAGKRKPEGHLHWGFLKDGFFIAAEPLHQANGRPCGPVNGKTQDRRAAD